MDLLKKTIIVLSATLMLWGCSDDDGLTNEGNATISLSTNILQVDKNGGDATVTVVSSDDWRLSGVCDWAHPSVTSGKSGDIVTFTIDPNSLDEKRTATFKFFTGSAIVPLQVESQPAYIMNLLSDGDISISKDKSTVNIQLETNIADPTIAYSDGGEEWLIFDRRIEFDGKVTLSFIAAGNDKYKDRSSTITISSPLVAEVVNVNVNQKQTDAIILESNTFMNDLTARKISFEMKYNVDYDISITQGSEWITNQSISEPQTNDDGLSTVIVAYELTEASFSRAGTIRIVNTDNTLINNIVLVQKDPNVEVFEMPDDNLRSFCIKNNWVISITGSQCIVLDAGQKATSLKYNDYNNEISDLTGIENFPNLESLDLSFCENMKKLDISGLHKVKTLSFMSAKICEEYNLGDNPIEDFRPAGGARTSINIESFKIITSVMETLDLSLYANQAKDNVTSIDVSECPALKDLSANRSDKLKTIYLKTGQVIPTIDSKTATIVYK